MKKLLITGMSGFVGHHFLQYLYDNKIEMFIYGVDIVPPPYDAKKYSGCLNIQFQIIDLLDSNGICNIFRKFTPDYILHLASYSSVAYSWKHPEESFINNTNIFLNMISAVKEYNISCRILSIGSSEEYGVVNPEDLPLKEDQKMNPISPYAVARVSQEMLSKVYSDSFQMNIIMTRSFNHIGPWQDERFAVPSFIKRILEIRESKNKKGVIKTGNVNIIRDFVDVRDVVRAYYLLLIKGRSGEVYNICSGNGINLSEIIELIAKQYGVEVTPKICKEYIRPNDNPIIIGDNQKIVNELGWKPIISTEETLRDMILNMQ